MKTIRLFPISLFICAVMLSVFNSCNMGNKKVFESYINSGWELESADKLNVGGEIISTPAFEYKNWNNINLPSTVLSGLVQTGKYKNIYFSNNLEKIPTEQFNQGWWYRKEFGIDKLDKNSFYSIEFEGINYKANIWINGKLAASQVNLEGPFRVFKLDITPFVMSKNVLAVEVFPPQKTDLTIGFVDWNPNTPDKNMGIWRGVKLFQSGKVSIENVSISSNISIPDYSEADLNIDVELKNHSSETVEGKLKATIESGIKIETKYQLKGNEVKRLVLNKTTSPELNIKNPRLWWPVNMGKPELYHAEFSVTENNSLSFSKKERFGIREIKDYTLNQGNEVMRGYIINGKKMLIKGGGWVDDMCLSDNDAKVRAQVEYVKHMNLNCIRLEGFWGNSKELYNACDENGILLMIGLSCQWEWESYSGRKETEFMNVDTKKDIELISQSFQDQVKWGMNHPSIFLWVFGSDKLPTPEFETALNKKIREYDTERCILASCKSRWQENGKYQISSVSGNPGSKMLGPYEYVPPIYWYEDKKLGGAYGFNTETSPGAQIPPIESILKMLTPEDADDINGKGWQYHCGRNQFQNLNIFLSAYEKRYWKDKNVKDFAFNVQMSNYESVRAMFEAFEVNRNTISTGIIQWMLNSAWPEMYWQLYDWYLNPNGAFYGTKTACQRVNLIYNYADKKIYVSNNTPKNESLKAVVNIFDINSKKIFETTVPVNAKSFTVKPLLKTELKNLSKVYFLSLKLYDAKSSREVANNFYWLSTQNDQLDYAKSDWYYTPQTAYADFKPLQNMENVKISSDVKFSTKGNKTLAAVTLSNPTNKIAFFIEMKIVDKKTGGTFLPVFWSDNYVSLLPNETKVFTAKFEKKDKMPDFVMRGFNLTK